MVGIAHLKKSLKCVQISVPCSSVQEPPINFLKDAIYNK